MTVYAEKESGEILEQVDNIHWVYGRKISEFTISASYRPCRGTSQPYPLILASITKKFELDLPPDGNYSTLVLDLLMQRQVGHYIISYYVPSALLVGSLNRHLIHHPM